MIGIPFTGIAAGLGKVMVKNVVALGALQAASQLFPERTFLHALRRRSDDCVLQQLNEQAFAVGREAVTGQSVS